MAKIMIDGKTYQVEAGKNLLHVCLSLGLNLPYFCWHPAMGSVGACRQCAVKFFKDEDDTRGKIVMACMEPASDGARISIEDPEAQELRSNVIEWLMTNHPHDCPICDEGGECHLQDMTVMTGHTYRRFRFNKRTFRNQYLGPFINHEMNRCIQCYRCVRFYRDYAGGRDLDAFAAHNHVYFGRHEDGVLENEFSGNLVEACPTGVFTDKTLKKHYTRKWDLQTAPSICHQCGLGCNIIPGERYGRLARILSRYNSELNGYFICDRGRFGYEYVNSEKRIRQILGREEPGGETETVSKEITLKYLSELLANTEKVIGIGSPRASLESNYALRKLVGPARFFSGMAAAEQRLVKLALDILKNGPARSPSLKEVGQADAVFILGEDLTNSASMMALALRQAVRQKPLKLADKMKIHRWHDAAVRELLQDEKGPFFIAAPKKTKLDDIATQTCHAAPDDLARLGFAVAHALNDNAPAVSGLSDDVQKLADQVARALKEAEHPLIVCGTSCQNEALMQAAANIAFALCNGEQRADLCFTVPECNTMGIAMMEEKSLDAALKAVQNGQAETVIILENDLYRRMDKTRADEFFGAAKHIIALDHLKNATNKKAEAVIPVGTFAEADGTLVNNEGRAQRFYRAMVPQGDIQESWRWLKDIMLAAGREEVNSWNSLNDVIGDLVTDLPVFAGIEKLTPPPGFRAAGQKIPRQPHRYSGRTAMNAHINVNEPKPPDDPDSLLSFSMEGYHGKPPSSIIPFFWSPGWNSVQSINKYQIEVGGLLHDGDPGLRLINPSQNGKATFFTGAPNAFQRRANEWLLLPLYHIFGSEELSALSPAIAERAPSPYLALNPEDAARLNLKEGDEAELKLNDKTHSLPVCTKPELPQGLAGAPRGIGNLTGLNLPGWCKIARAKK